MSTFIGLKVNKASKPKGEEKPKTPSKPKGEEKPKTPSKPKGEEKK